MSPFLASVSRFLPYGSRLCALEIDFGLLKSWKSSFGTIVVNFGPLRNNFGPLESIFGLWNANLGSGGQILGLLDTDLFVRQSNLELFVSLLDLCKSC